MQAPELADTLAMAPAAARPNAGVQHVNIQFRPCLEPHLQSSERPRKRLGVKIGDFQQFY
jgi:hypothetical protein